MNLPVEWWEHGRWGAKLPVPAVLIDIVVIGIDVRGVIISDRQFVTVDLSELDMKWETE